MIHVNKNNKINKTTYIPQRNHPLFIIGSQPKSDKFEEKIKYKDKGVSLHPPRKIVEFVKITICLHSVIEEQQ